MGLPTNPVKNNHHISHINPNYNRTNSSKNNNNLINNLINNSIYLCNTNAIYVQNILPTIDTIVAYAKTMTYVQNAINVKTNQIDIVCTQ